MSLKTKISLFIRWSLVIVGIYFVFQILSIGYALVSGSSIKDVTWLFFSGELAQDAENRTNFLILGTGGGKHDGADLTDTFMIASYNHDYGTLSLLSIPRDFYVKAEDGYGMRINEIYEYEKRRLDDSESALESTAKMASRVSGVPIHYYLKVNFQGFTDLVDALGGVKVLVKDSISDPYYPCPGLTGYCPFELSAGVHTLDGQTALRFARSRKTTSDFDRAARQQQILTAIREKAFAQDMLLDPSKLQDLYSILSENMETNLRFRELITLAKLADGFDRNKIASVVLSDEPNFTGGLLYSPNREDYGGAAVLIPEGNDYRRIHTLTEVFFGYPQVAAAKLPIEVLNSTGKANLASDAAYWLNRYGFETYGGNYPGQPLDHTTVYYYDPEDAIAQKTIAALKNFIDADYRTGPTEMRRRGFGITVILGKDWRGGE